MSLSQIKELASFTADPNPNVTRIIFTSEDASAREYIRKQMHGAGLTIR